MVAALLCASPAGASPPIPTAAFAQLPPVRWMTLSPDGNRIAMERAINGAYGLTVLDIATRTEHPALVADPARFQLSRCSWVSNQRLVCELRTHASVAQGGSGDAGRLELAWVLHAVNADGSDPLPLLENKSERHRGILGHRLIGTIRDDPDHVLVSYQSTWQTSRYGHPSVLRVNTRTGDATRVIRSRDGVDAWLADATGRVRLGVGFGRARYRFVRPDGDRWVTTEIDGLADDPHTRLIHVAAHEPVVTFESRDDQGRMVVRAANFVTGTPGRELAAHPRFDVTADSFDIAGVLHGLVVHERESRFVALSPQWQGIDEQLRAVAMQLGGDVTLLPMGADADGRRALLRASTPFRPASWYLYDTAARQLARLASEYPALEGEPAPHARWIEYPARDGTPIPAILTTPAGMDANALPTIVLPHGGPVAHDTSRFDFLAGFLAARGYAVLQPNYRGSTGYGRTFMEAGFGQWGERMQDDLVDGLDWLRKEGIADPQRACMVGLSYGGYAALVAAYKTPERLRCVVSYAGIADLDLFVRNRGGYRLVGESMKYLNLLIDRDRMAANSPALHADAFGVPVLLLHPDRDVNVLVEQSRAMASALAAAGKPHRYVEQRNGDHFLEVQAHRTELLLELEQFLAAHLLPQSNGVGGDQVQSKPARDCGRPAGCGGSTAVNTPAG